MSIKKINQFSDGADSLSSDDIFLFMDDPDGSALTKKITLSDLGNFVGVGSGVIISDTSVIPEGSGIAITNIVAVSQTVYDNLTPEGGVLYIIIED
jgi:F420-0:gamma-glutamyl ligase